MDFINANKSNKETHPCKTHPSIDTFSDFVKDFLNAEVPMLRFLNGQSLVNQRPLRNL